MTDSVSALAPIECTHLDEATITKDYTVVWVTISE